MIIRTEKNQEFTTISNYALNDPVLSLKAKGLWAFIMSKPDEWNISSRGLSSQLKEGRDAILGALKELENAGYLKRGIIREDNGTFAQTENILYEKPWWENQGPVSSSTYINTNKVNTNKIQKNIKKEDFIKNSVLDSDSFVRGRSAAGLPPRSAAPRESDFRKITEKLGESLQVKYLEQRKKIFKARLKTFTLDDILLAADNLSQSAWHMGVDPNNTKKYACFDFLMRNDQQVDKWKNVTPVKRYA